MRTSICLLAFLAIASVAMAAFVPVTGVTCTNPIGTAPFILKSITTGIAPNTTTIAVEKLGLGTTSSASVPEDSEMPNLHDLDLNTICTGWTYPLQTVLFGGKPIFSTNGSQPDFFLFEAAGSGDPEDNVYVAPIFEDNTQGTPVALPNNIAAGWGDTGYRKISAPQAGQWIIGVSWDITEMKDAAGVSLSPNAVIKGIRFTSGGGIDPAMIIAAIPQVLRGQAHTPVPADAATLIDPATTTQVSWYSPEQDNLGAFKDDPNIVAVTGYKYWFGTVEPNEFTQTPTTTTSKNFNVSLAYKTTYKWCVDTLVTWDSIAVTGTINDTIKGYTWQFTTQSPTMTFNGVITTQAFLPAALSASVLGFANPITSATFTLLTDDIEFPDGAIASVTSTTTNLQTPTATLTTDKPGKYKVKLVVTDGTDTVEKIAGVLVYAAADDCAARKAAGGWVANYYDRNSSCVVNLGDFAPLAVAWLSNTGLLAQQTYTGAVVLVPKAIFDARIEAESVSLTDPNAVSNPPVTDTTGIRIDVEPTAIGGGKNLGSTVSGFAQYTINIPAAGTYDLHLCTAAAAAGNVLDFGIAGTPALYGSVTGLPYPGWDKWQYTVHPGALTFTAAGPTTVRITWNATARDLDWFTLVKQ